MLPLQGTKKQTHPAQWDGLEGNGGTHSVIFAYAEIQKYNHPRMEPRIREVDQGMGTRVLACLSSFLPLRSLRLGGENVFKSKNLTAKTQSSLRSRIQVFLLFFFSFFLPLRSLRLGGENVFVLYRFLGRCPRLVDAALSGHKGPIY